MHIDPALKEELKQYLMERLNDTHKKVTIISAYPLEQKEMDSLTHHFSELKHARLENHVDTSIMAGYVIKFGTKMIDISLRRKLEDVNRSLSDILE